MTPLFRPPAANVTLVSDLIDTDNWTWQRDLIRENFITPDAEAILNIPLRAGGGDDFLAWAHEISGNYTVKSAYQALVTRNELQALEEGQATGPSTDKQRMWNDL